MSDFDSATSTPAPIGHHPPKRRRVYDDSEASTPRYSSPDDLADPKPHRSSKLRDHHDSGSKRGSIGSHSSDGSEDDLDHAYRRRARSRSGTIDTDTPRSSHSSPRRRTPPARPPLKLNYKQKFILRGHKKGVSQVRFSPDGHWIASCSADATIKIWDAATGQHMRTMEGHLKGISTIAWSADSNTIASGSDDKTIRLWHRATGKAYPAPLTGHSNYVYSLAFSPKGNMLVSGSYDEAVFLWDLRARKLMRSLPAHSDPVSAVDFIRDGTLVCSCSTDGLIRVWDTATGQCLRTIVHEDNAPVTAVRFSPNGKYILASTLDSCIRLWDYVSGTCKKTYQGHVNNKYSIGAAFGTSRGEPFIVSGSEDGHILFWDIRNKAILQNAVGHQGVVCWVDTCSDGSGKIVTGGLDGTVSIWVDVEEDLVHNDRLGEMDGLKMEREDDDVGVDGHIDGHIDEVKRDGSIGDTPRKASPEDIRSPGAMDET